MRRSNTDYHLLRLSYTEAKNIKNFLRNWSNLERLGYKGNTVAICILVDLKQATGIDFNNLVRGSKGAEFMYPNNTPLTYAQFMAVTMVLILGYTQREVAERLKTSQSAISQSINGGIKAIQSRLGEEMITNEDAERGCGG